MTDGSSPPAGWYPVQNDPSSERYWDGQVWTDHVRTTAGLPAVQPPAQAFEQPGKPSKQGNTRVLIAVGVGILLAIAAAIGLLLVLRSDGGDDSAGEEAQSTTTVEVAETTGTTGTTGSTVAEGDGTLESPLPFGQSSQSDTMFQGAVWTLSIDEVRSGLALDPVLAAPGEARTCVAVIGTATLDQLSDPAGRGDFLSFPDVRLVDDGAEVFDGFLECDHAGLQTDGLVWDFELDVGVGETVQFYVPYLVTNGDWDSVSLGSTFYR